MGMTFALGMVMRTRLVDTPLQTIPHRFAAVSRPRLRLEKRMILVLIIMIVW